MSLTILSTLRATQRAAHVVADESTFLLGSAQNAISVSPLSAVTYDFFLVHLSSGEIGVLHRRDKAPFRDQSPLSSVWIKSDKRPQSPIGRSLENRGLWADKSREMPVKSGCSRARRSRGLLKWAATSGTDLP